MVEACIPGKETDDSMKFLVGIEVKANDLEVGLETRQTVRSVYGPASRKRSLTGFCG